ncbi:hypothetical protein SAMN04488548_13110 [Gordonia westfalica]|uniref:Uncharacterized protein n=1 Tax=Gordonia westfalica TaxID=158898 RepID=A0A1H2EFZ4_9ACTN|nr:hypothetical protein SAMN04488548_13110 [Gordonia westfalica]
MQRPDGTWVQTGPGGYDATGGSGTSGSSTGDKSISGRLGAVANTFVSEQIADMLKVFSINDTPGILAPSLNTRTRSSNRFGDEGVAGGA